MEKAVALEQEGATNSPKASAASGWTRLIDGCILAVGMALLIYVYWGNTSFLLKAVVSSILVFVAVYLLISSLLAMGQVKETDKGGEQGITRLVLLDEDGQCQKEWYINGEISLLIGKSSKDSEADIDLSDSEYAALISHQHAVLNYASGSWYIEDVDSRNGVGIRKARQKETARLEPEEPHPLLPGDMIYIANTRLLVK